MDMLYGAYIFSKMLLSRVNFYSWLMSLWSRNVFSEVNVMMRDIVYKLLYCYIIFSAVGH